MLNSRYRLEKHFKVAKIAAALAFLIGTLGLIKWAYSSISHGTALKVADGYIIAEGPVSTGVVTVGPFDLHRRYLSMEGPWSMGTFSPAQMIASKNITLPEGMIHFLEDGGGAASMNGSHSQSSKKASNNNASAIGLVRLPKQPRELYWFKGVKLEVLDEKGVVQPTAEFICHWNLDVEPRFRNQVFPNGHKTLNTRLSSISQGETVQILPPGYGVPVASDELLQLSFQAANRTTDVHRRVTHRCTLYFVRDKDLHQPIKALYFYVPYVTVVTDKNTKELNKKACPVCVGQSEGMDAPNDKIGGTFRDPENRVVSGHWVIPPGIHTYCDTITAPRDPGFQVGNPVVRAAWTHVHPLCTKFSLVECTEGKRSIVLNTTCETKTKPGLQIMHLDFLTPKGGVQLHESSIYELEVTYNNPFPKAVDSMASMGIYMEDPAFVRPEWTVNEGQAEGVAANNVTEKDQQNLMSCAIPKGGAGTAQVCKSTVHAVADNTPADILEIPLFDKNKDGPLLRRAEIVKIETNAGPISLRLDPALAPITATYMYKLFSSGAFDGTPIHGYSPNFVLEISSSWDKAPGQSPMANELRSLLRRAPLEVSTQKDNHLNHHKYVLSMTRYSGNSDTATGAFSILVGDAPQLDHQYTIFGRIEEDPATLKTLAKIENNWHPTKYWITGNKTTKKIASANH